MANADRNHEKPHETINKSFIFTTESFIFETKTFVFENKTFIYSFLRVPKRKFTTHNNLSHNDITGNNQSKLFQSTIFAR